MYFPVKFYVILKPSILPLCTNMSIKIVEGINALSLERSWLRGFAERGFNKVLASSDSSSRSCRDNIPCLPPRRISLVIKFRVNIASTK